ncbi:MAG: DUF4296 domain-containing protein [Chitinophagaceae bacterium]|nr:MAG: DUF4296 domain-containing protein [Chitinophagaceae bacterium]
MKTVAKIFLVISACFFWSCKSKVPGSVLPLEKMQDVYWDYLRADIYANEPLRNDSTSKPEKENLRLQRKIFELHKIDAADFYKSYDYYLKHPILMGQLLDTMTVRQQAKLDTLRARKEAKIKASKISVDKL